MIREVELSEISDGKLYRANDMVKADTNQCKGCSNCCRGMGESIILDPMDVYRLTMGLGVTFEQLLQSHLELNVVDGIILPNLRMQPEKDCCAFLNEEGRCSIHSIRPGICRLFPLGRYYEDRSFFYILQTHECPVAGKTKVKVKKWVDTANLPKYEQFIKDWHFLMKDMAEAFGEQLKEINMFLLNTFFITPWDKDMDFYEQFDARYQQAKKLLK